MRAATRQRGTRVAARTALAELPGRALVLVPDVAGVARAPAPSRIAIFVTFTAFSTSPEPGARGVEHRHGEGQTTKLQEAAYNAQLAAGLPVSELARALLIVNGQAIDYRRCASYIYAIQDTNWFRAAFASGAEPVTVVGGRGVSTADAAQRLVKIGTSDRRDAGTCEQACLHELAHIVTPDHGPGHELRKLACGIASSRGHHHAWRVNFILIVRKTLGNPAAQRLRHEFGQWGLPTCR